MQIHLTDLLGMRPAACGSKSGRCQQNYFHLDSWLSAQISQLDVN
jgi:hypothetical protein